MRFLPRFFIATLAAVAVPLSAFALADDTATQWSDGEVINVAAPLPSALPVPGRKFSFIFDDGPLPDSTPIILDALKRANMKATFCVVGKNVNAYPDLARRIVAEGHEIANRTWSNTPLVGMSPDQMKSEIEACSDAIKRVTGVPPRFFRPPQSLTNSDIEDVAQSLGLVVLMHSLDSGDWRKTPSGPLMSKVILTGITPGAIVLAHESFPSSVKELPGVIEQLSRRGYQSVTVTELKNLAGARYAGSVRRRDME